MDTNLQSYIKTYRIYDREFCDQTVQQLTDVQFSKHVFYDAILDKDTTYDTDLSVSYSKIPNTKELAEKIWNAINQYIVEDFKFPWFTGWSAYVEPRFNRYDVGTEMKRHCDHIRTIFDGTNKGIPILSVVGILNDNYKGGEFIMFDDTKIDLEVGDILVFPSNFLYPHKVNMVTEGTRHSFVSWVW
jgi:predicted 2-oxoglutarate/Fe(II)-dependent dioxygenase YbiX